MSNLSALESAIQTLEAEIELKKDQLKHIQASIKAAKDEEKVAKKVATTQKKKLKEIEVELSKKTNDALRMESVAKEQIEKDREEMLKDIAKLEKETKKAKKEYETWTAQLEAEYAHISNEKAELTERKLELQHLKDLATLQKTKAEHDSKVAKEALEKYRQMAVGIEEREARLDYKEKTLEEAYKRLESEKLALEKDRKVIMEQERESTKQRVANDERFKLLQAGRLSLEQKTTAAKDLLARADRLKHDLEMREKELEKRTLEFITQSNNGGRSNTE